MRFRISALNVNKFTHLLGLDDEVLLQQRAWRIIVDNNPGFPSNAHYASLSATF